jgi:hypothetical protein
MLSAGEEPVWQVAAQRPKPRARRSATQRPAVRGSLNADAISVPPRRSGESCRSSRRHYAGVALLSR